MTIAGIPVGSRGVPVVMYHSVGGLRPDWPENYLITPLEVFEGQMRLLKDAGWTAITLKELYDHMSSGKPLPPKPVVLTFDDGYLDNWVFAFPILRKYGHRGVVWMSTDFVDPSSEAKPTLEDVWHGRRGLSDLEERGYLSWKEMREMSEAGVLETQSHAATHTWYPKGPRIVDFHRPSGVDGYNPPPWLAWNRFPQRKYESLTARLEDIVPYGTPVYECGKSLQTVRYLEDPGLAERLADAVRQGGGADFFRRPGWREELNKVVEDYGERRDGFETEAAYAERVRRELSESKRLIEKHVGKGVDFLCWPGGAWNKIAMEIAFDVGYLSTTTHFEDPVRRNTFGQDPREINRIGCASPWAWRAGVIFHHTDPGFFIAGLDYFAGSRKSLWTMRAYKLKYLLRYYLTGKT